MIIQLIARNKRNYRNSNKRYQIILKVITANIKKIISSLRVNIKKKNNDQIGAYQIYQKKISISLLWSFS